MLVYLFGGGCGFNISDLVEIGFACTSVGTNCSCPQTDTHFGRLRIIRGQKANVKRQWLWPSENVCIY